MRSLRIAAPVALGVATLVGVGVVPNLMSASSSAQPARAVVSYEDPSAHASQVEADDVVPVVPSTVNIRLVRAEAALERATAAVDQGQEALAIPEIVGARDNMVKAWTAAKYIISQPPPPDPEAPPDPEDPPDPTDPPEPPDPPDPADVEPGPYTAPADTAAAVLNLQHDVVTTSLGLLDAAGPDLAATLRGTISGTMSARDAAINYIQTIAPPVAEEGRVQAEASDAPVGGTFDIVMPLFVPQLDDEILQTNTTAMSASSPANFGGWVALKAGASKNLINTFWPPVTEG